MPNDAEGCKGGEINPVNNPEQEKVRGIGHEDIIDFGDRPVKIVGFTAPEGNPGRAFVTQELTPVELEEYQKRKSVISGKIKEQIEANPNAIIDIEQAKRYWGRIYDQGKKTGSTMEMQLNELYAQKYEQQATAAQERIKIAEQQLKFIKTEAEKQALFSKIAEERVLMEEMRREAHQRRGYGVSQGQVEELKTYDKSYQASAEVNGYSVKVEWQAYDEATEPGGYEIHVGGEASIHLATDPSLAKQIFDYAVKIAQTESDPARLRDEVLEYADDQLTKAGY